jgi:hypothetical protein
MSLKHMSKTLACAYYHAWIFGPKGLGLWFLYKHTHTHTNKLCAICQILKGHEKKVLGHSKSNRWRLYEYLPCVIFKRKIWNLIIIILWPFMKPQQRERECLSGGPSHPHCDSSLGYNITYLYHSNWRDSKEFLGFSWIQKSVPRKVKHDLSWTRNEST